MVEKEYYQHRNNLQQPREMNPYIRSLEIRTYHQTKKTNYQPFKHEIINEFVTKNGIA